jgi:hypothetical protein
MMEKQVVRVSPVRAAKVAAAIDFVIAAPLVLGLALPMLLRWQHCHMDSNRTRNVRHAEPIAAKLPSTEDCCRRRMYELARKTAAPAYPTF